MKPTMQKIIAAAVAAAMIVPATAAPALVSGYEPPVKKEILAGIIRKEIKPEKSYQLVKVNGNFKVYLKQGDDEKVEVEGDEGILSEVKHFVSNNTLNIYTSDKVKKRLKLHITMKDTDNLDKFGRVRVIKE